MASNPGIAEELRVLQRRWEGLTDAPVPPRSTMDVIEYGLGDQQRAEVYVNRLLCYLLDPDQPHQMQTEFLAAFLDGLPTACEFEEDTYDLSDVRVREQVPIWNHRAGNRDDDETPGYVDVLLDVPNEWFLLVELKFSAPETGTAFYCAAEQIGDELVSDYESGQYYLFVHQGDRPEATGECFANLSWRRFVQDVLTPFRNEHAPRFPQRTVMQLHDLNRDLQHIAGMTDQSTTDQEKIALYLEHVDAITDVTATFDEQWSEYASQWGSDMAASLTHPRVTPLTEDSEEYASVTVDRDDGEEQWILSHGSGDWQHVYKAGWICREDTGETLLQRASDSNDLRIGFYHRMGDGGNRDTAVRDRKLRFNFRCMGSNPTEFRNIYNDHFDENVDVIEESLTGAKTELTGQKRTMIRGTYPIVVDDHDDIFAAYTAALNDAFLELVVENPRLVRTLTDIFEATVQDFSGDSV